MGDAGYDSEAVRRSRGQQLIHTYIAAQAAVSGHCYDNTLPNYWDDFVHPHIHGRWFSGVGTDEPYFEGNDSKVGQMVNYANPVDYALKNWRTYNEWKPIPATGYGYTEGDANVDSYTPDPGDRFYRLLTTLTIPADRYEVFSRILQSRSAPLGQVPQVAGFTFRNLENAPFAFDDTPYSHSRQFRSNVVNERDFWGAVVQDA